MSSPSSTSGPKPGRRRANDRSEIPVSFLPAGNRAAKWAYICAWLGLIPGVGVVTGWPAMLLGWAGRRAAHNDEHKRGLGHAVVSMALGGIEVVSQGAGWWLLVSSF